MNMTHHSRFQVPNHDNSIVASTREPPPRMRPTNNEYGSRMHGQCAQRFGWLARILVGLVEYRLGTPYSNFCIETTGCYSGSVRVHMYREYGQFLWVSTRSLRVCVTDPRGFSEAHEIKSQILSSRIVDLPKTPSRIDIPGP
jgi:hypothetical protein